MEKYISIASTISKITDIRKFDDRLNTDDVI